MQSDDRVLEKKNLVTLFFEFLEYAFERFLGRPYNLISFYYLVLESAVKNFPKGYHCIFNNTLRQVYVVGIRAVKNTTLISFFLGAVAVTQVSIYVRDVAGWTVVGQVISFVLIRELLPVLMAITLVAKNGTAMATELSLMKINGELLSLKSLGIDSLYFIVIPRLVGFSVSLIVVTVVAAILSVISGGLTLFTFQNISLYDFFSLVSVSLSLLDIFLFFFKTVVFGLTIPLICCFYGLSVTHKNISMASTNAVMGCFYYIFLVNFITDFLAFIWN